MKKSKSNFKLREELEQITPITNLSLSEQIKKMRRATNKTQIEFAKLIGIAPRIIIDLENNKGNPTLSTLNKIGRLFDFEISFTKRKIN